MKTLLFTALLLARLSAQSLPVVPMQTDPDQLARSLRDRRPMMPMADCKALDLRECRPDEPSRVTDVSVRWVQLDDDPELEAVLITQATAENTYAAFVFDKQGTWNLVGVFFCQRWTCDKNDLIRVQKLTQDSPPLLLCYRDVGGSGTVALTTEAFQLRQGKLWPVFQVTNYEQVPYISPRTKRQRVLAAPNRLVIHTIREEPPGQITQNKCEVLRWDAASHTFVPTAEQPTKYCDPKTGKPIAGNSFWTGLPAYP
jgi:hypothetical protein